MKRTVQQLFAVLIMAVCYSAVALAAVSPYDALQVTPAEGNVTSLQHFTITFADMSVIVRDGAIPTLEKGGGGTVAGTMRAGDDGKSVLIDFEECFTVPGHYFLNIPDASLTVNGQTLLPLTLRFIIPVTPESFYEQITIDPAEGTVESLQNFTLSLPLVVGEIEYGMEAKLTNTNTGESWSADIYDVGYHVLVYFPDEVTAPGNYVFTIPAGAIIIYTLGEDVHELNFNYTIAGGTDVLVGDVNGDGNVNITDVTALIDILLSSSETSAAADVNGDSSVNITDVTALIDLLLGGQ